MSEQHYVYLIEGDGLHKIGFSADPQQRSVGLSGSGKRRELIHSFPCGDCRAVEGRLHAYFEPKRVRGEWFNLDTDDVLLVCSIIACPGVEDLPAAIRDAVPSVRKKWGSSNPRPGKRTLYIELDEQTRADLEAMAARNVRTIKGEVVLALEAHLAANSAPAEPGPVDQSPKPRKRRKP